MYKYTLFDIDNTLLDFSKGESEAIRAVFQSEDNKDSKAKYSIQNLLELKNII